MGQLEQNNPSYEIQEGSLEQMSDTKSCMMISWINSLGTASSPQYYEVDAVDEDDIAVILQATAERHRQDNPPE